MSTQLQLRKGNTAQTAVFTGALAEVTVDTDQKTVVVHDGTTVGGTYIITRAQLDSNVSILQGINTSQNTRISIIEGVNLGQNTTITAVNNFAQSSYDTANATNNFAVSAFNKANSANVLAQSAFDSSNAVNGYAASAFLTANGANGLAVGAYDTANAANGMAVGAYAAANSAYSYTTQVQAIADAAYLKANSAFDSSNAVNGYAVSAFATANGANGLAQGAFNTANTNAGNITIIQGVDLTQNTNITAVNAFAGSAFDTANGANSLAQSAFNTANTNASNITVIQGVDLTQNTNITTANNHAWAAFDKANTGGTFTGDVTVEQNLTVDKNLIVTGNLIIGGNTTSISANNLVINDPIIILANNNTLDVVDIGFIGHYDEFGPDEYRHTGVIRHAETNEYYIFYNYDKHIHANTGANNIINILDPSFLLSNVNGGYFKGNLIATTAVVGGVNIRDVQDTQSANITIIQGVDLAQNTRMSIIEGVDNTQNTNITAVNNFAAGAFVRANNSLNLTTGGVVAGNVTANSVIANNSIYSPVIYSTGATTNLTLSDIGLVAISVAGQTYQFGASGIESNQGVFGGSFGGNRLSLNNETNLISNRYDTVKIQTGSDGSVVNEFTFANNTVTLPGAIIQTNAARTSNTFTTSSTSQITVDSFSASTYRSAKYQVQVTSGSAYHIIELNLVHNGTTVFLAQYGEVLTGSSLGTFDADISGGNVRLLFTGVNSVSVVKVIRDAINI
jgi:hypothetical protein